MLVLTRRQHAGHAAELDTRWRIAMSLTHALQAFRCDLQRRVRVRLMRVDASLCEGGNVAAHVRLSDGDMQGFAFELPPGERFDMQTRLGVQAAFACAAALAVAARRDTSAVH